jgi:hypothetical protein
VLAARRSCLSHIIACFSEATADPAFLLVTSIWYTRQQQPTIIGYWYSANGIGIAVGGLLGYGIGNVRPAFIFVAVVQALY